MIDVSIIILSYNGKALLAQTLDSVKNAAISRINVETIVSDNGSTDGSIELVVRDYPWVKLLENGDNLGYSKGNNRGIAVASGKYILFLNSDTKISQGVIEYIYDQMEKDSSIGVATCRVELANGEIDPASHRGFPTPWRAFCYFVGLERLAIQSNLPNPVKEFFGGYHLVERDLTVSHEVDACTGAFLMISRSLGDQIEWWSEDYFMYGEDLDFCYKVKSIGKKILYFPEYTILHLKHQSGLKRDTRADDVELEKKRAIKRKTTEAFYDAMIIFYEKFYKDQYPFVVRYMVYSFVRVKKWYALSKI